MQILTSHVAQVTVFPTRAQILRKASIDLPAGEHLLVFDNLPIYIDQKSIQVSGAGKAIIGKVQFQQTLPTRPPDEEIQALQAQKQTQDRLIREQDDRIKRLHKQKEMLDGISKRVTHPTDSAADLNPESWLKMLEFYQNQLAETDAQILACEQRKREEEQILTQANWRLQQLNAQGNQRKNQVLVGIEAKEAGTFELRLAYIVTQASWTPVYDLRVSTETKQMQIVYKGIVQQQTGELWDNVELQLSTAQPAISGQQPALTPWRVDMPPPHVQTFAAVSGARSMPSALAMTNMMPVQQETEEELDDEMGEIGMETYTAHVETKATSVLFNIAGRYTVKSDQTDHQVTIMQADFAAHFRYSTVPKLATYAYLKVRVRNETPFPFLAGETNIFLDGNFVAHAALDAVAPTEEFWTFLGIDESMKVNYKFVKKYEKKEGGMFSKKVRIWIYEYLITLHNHKRTEEEIVVWDQLPISGNEQIKVHLIEPLFKENTERLKKNDLEYLEWFFRLKPSEEMQIPFKFSVEYPHDAHIRGL